MSKKIKSFVKVKPMIYAYNTIGVEDHEDETKIGYTESQSVEDRIYQQTHTVSVRVKVAWSYDARYDGGDRDYFKDYDFHKYLVKSGVSRRPRTEWFKIDGDGSERLFCEFKKNEHQEVEEGREYVLRDEQEKAVLMTLDYFSKGGDKFLWNAKPRFGKTLTAYDLICRMECFNVLIVTNRPAIAHSWYDEFRKYIAWNNKYEFVAGAAELQKEAVVVTYQQHLAHNKSAQQKNTPETGMIAFVSLQKLKESSFFGGQHANDVEWVGGQSTHFDLMIVDESQEGVDTERTEEIFQKINRDHTLYLSGTPFKALALGQFNDDQIFNWSYVDEQKAKSEWNKRGNKDETLDGIESNPYEDMPNLEMYTYRISDVVSEKIRGGIVLDEKKSSTDFFFNLNDFFKTNGKGKFKHEEEVNKFIQALHTQERYPFTRSYGKNELSHTLWLMNRVDSVKALRKLLEQDSYFKKYHVVIAAGKGGIDDFAASDNSYERVKNAIAKYKKTITLSVGQLTVGVTIPEWSGVLMLCKLDSPSAYMQAAFRVQNPYMFTDNNGKCMRKKTAYVFDFDPTRTLTIYGKFADNLYIRAKDRTNSNERGENVKELLNFFPVLGEDKDGKMVQLDAEQVLSIPNMSKGVETVRRGFGCVYLIENIPDISGAPNAVLDIFCKLKSSKAIRNCRNAANGDDSNDGNDILAKREVGLHNDLFGDAVYREYKAHEKEFNEAFGRKNDVDEKINEFEHIVKKYGFDEVSNVVDSTISRYKLDDKKGRDIRNEIESVLSSEFKNIREKYSEGLKGINEDSIKNIEDARTYGEIDVIESELSSAVFILCENMAMEMLASQKRVITEKKEEISERLEKSETKKRKRELEDDTRECLYTFAKTVPSLIMAYDDGNLKLENIEANISDESFKEVTGITKREFLLLRDGYYVDPETGERNQIFEKGVFDATVFNNSINEFRIKRRELRNYLELETEDETIFDYIPSIKDNLVYTPHKTVIEMVNMMEENNPGCFDDPEKTFADLYMKSGLYIAEIVKRLFRSEAIKAQIPDDKMRIWHILTKQVYGMAPTEATYLVSTSYILGFCDGLDRERDEFKNFVCADSMEASRHDNLEGLVNKYFGESEVKDELEIPQKIDDALGKWCQEK